MRVGNGLPTLTSCTITPATAYTDDELTVTPGGYSDPDADPEGYQYQWYRNGSPIGGATFATLSGVTYFGRGDDITVDCTAFDGYSAGTTVTSGTRTIQDSPPTAPTVDVTPEEPEDDDYLACAVVGASTDADGDAIAYAYAWTRDGVATGLTSTTVDPSATSNGET